MAADIQKEITALRQMTVHELRRRHVELFGEDNRSANRQYLLRRIAWRLQALAEGDLSERARRRAEVLARDADLRSTAPRTPPATPGGNGAKDANGAKGAKPAASLADERVPPPGTVLARVYGDKPMAANVYMRTIEVSDTEWRALADTSLVMNAWVHIWTSATVVGSLFIRANGGDPASIPKNVDFNLEGVDLSQIEVMGNPNYRVTVIACSR